MPSVRRRARAACAAAWTLHVHIAPDVDRAAHRRRLRSRAASQELGLAGFAAEVALHPDRRARPRSSAASSRASRCFGAVALNRAVGGMNPLAVEIAGARGRADGVAPDRRRATTRRPGAREPRRAPSCRRGASCSRSCARRACDIEPVAVVDDDGARAARDARRAQTVARHGMRARDRPPRPRRDLRRRRRRRRGGRARHRRDAPRVPRRRTSASRTRSSSPRRGALLERCFTTPHTGKVHVGALAGGHPRDRPRALGALDRPRPARQPAGRGRAAR